MSSNLAPSNPFDLVDAFRSRYSLYEAAVAQALTEATNDFSLLRLQDELQEFLELVQEHGGVLDPTEQQTLQLNLVQMRHDILLHHEEMVSGSHHGQPEIVYQEYTGRPGRPRTLVDPNFMNFAYYARTTSGAARFVGVGRTRYRELLLENGIAEPGHAPFSPSNVNQDDGTTSQNGAQDGGWDHIDDQAEEEEDHGRQLPGYLTDITDHDLDDVVLQLKIELPHAGVSMLNGRLRSRGIRVPLRRIRLSLLRVDPVRRVFERVTIRRRGYNVPGPLALWHHDGQHGLIRWGIVIHGFIDGYSRFITGLRASGNNYAATVLDIFLTACYAHGVPLRCRGDHGTENLFVAEWMERHYPPDWKAYFWGRSVHNIRIERLWVDVTVQVGSVWYDLFTMLELDHGLDIHNPFHIWLLHHLFLPTLNASLIAFAEAWNCHSLNIRGGPNRSPEDMFTFDQLANGVRGYELELTGDEGELYGLDWEALQDDELLASRAQNNPVDEEATSWTGQGGPPPRLNEVWVDQPQSPLTAHEMESLDNTVGEWLGSANSNDVALAWRTGLAFCRLLSGDF